MLARLAGLAGPRRRRFPRRHDRYQCGFAVTVVDPRRHLMVAGTLSDIGQGGCLLRLERPFFFGGGEIRLVTHRREVAATIVGRSQRGTHCRFTPPLTIAELAQLLPGYRPGEGS